MARDAVAIFDDMLTELLFLQEATADRDVDDMLEDETLRRGIERSLEILGEAAKAMPAETRQRWRDLPWSEMARMRDLLIQSYHRSEPYTVWKTAIEDAVPLLDSVKGALDGEKRRAAGTRS